MQLAAPGAPPQQSASQLLRASDGKMRMDYGNTSVITNPVAQHAIILDHIKLVARVIPIPPPGPMPKIPQLGMPAAPGAPTPPPVSSVDLGKGFIEGHAVTGTQLTFHMPTMPQAPGMPKVPGMPQAPGAPTAPGMPQAPGAPRSAGRAQAGDAYGGGNLDQYVAAHAGAHEDHREFRTAYVLLQECAYRGAASFGVSDSARV